MKTILHLIETSGPGGAERMLISLVEALPKHEYRSLICLLKEGWLNDELRRRGFETVIIPQPRTVDVSWLWAVWDMVRDRRVDLMHSHEFAMNTYGSLVSLITGVPQIATVHGKNYYYKRWDRRLAYRFVARHGRMVAVSEDCRKFLSDNVGVPRENILTIYNGIPIEQHEQSNSIRTKVRAALGISLDQPVIGTVGNLYPVKGQTFLLQAMSGIVRHWPDCRLIIVGRGELESTLKREAKELGIERNVLFLGYRPDVPELLQAMDVFVLPSLSEGLSLSILEAMAAGKPVVATAVGGNPEVILDSETGYLVPSANPGALAEKIIALLQDPLLAHEIGKNSRTRVMQHFSLSAMVNRYLMQYAELLGSTPHIAL
jgi:sugar transferase (PEP-CTERM/EpsH1 system associated)